MTGDGMAMLKLKFEIKERIIHGITVCDDSLIEIS